MVDERHVRMVCYRDSTRSRLSWLRKILSPAIFRAPSAAHLASRRCLDVRIRPTQLGTHGAIPGFATFSGPYRSRDQYREALGCHARCLISALTVPRASSASRRTRSARVPVRRDADRITDSPHEEIKNMGVVVGGGNSSGGMSSRASSTQQFARSHSIGWLRIDLAVWGG